METRYKSLSRIAMKEQVVTKFAIQQGEASLVAHFVSPVFGLLESSGWRLHQNMLQHLGKYGLSLNDIQIQLAIPNLAGGHASYTINALSAVTRVWLDRLEITFLDITRITQSQLIEIAGAALTALQQTLSDIALETYTARLALHGSFQDMPLSQFVQQYVKPAPEELGSLLGSGVVYYLGPKAERRAASLVIDRSIVVSEAAFINASMILDGTKLPMDNAPTTAREAILKMLEAAGIEIHGGD